MIETVAKWLIKYCEWRGKVFRITGTAGPEDVYLIRYYVIRSSWFNFYIHIFLRSDRDDMHDHPWDFCTYLVRGAYIERKWNFKERRTDVIFRSNWPDIGYGEEKQNRLVFRKATDLHQVMTPEQYSLSRINEAPMTLFFSGPKRREWGFVRQSTRQWVHWKEYLGLPADAPDRG